MKIVYYLITIIYVGNTNVMDGMMLFDGEQHLERLLQKSLKYQHHQKNYEKSLETGIMRKGLNIKSVSIPTRKLRCFYNVGRTSI